MSIDLRKIHSVSDLAVDLHKLVASALRVVQDQVDRCQLVASGKAWGQAINRNRPNQEDSFLTEFERLRKAVRIEASESDGAPCRRTAAAAAASARAQ